MDKINHNFSCSYCDVEFPEKRLLLNHQKTKKCMVYRTLMFRCKKCFKEITGHDNAISHSLVCKEQLNDNGLLESLIEQLKLRFDTTLTFNETKNEGVLTFKKANNYSHIYSLTNGQQAPQKYNLIKKLCDISDVVIKGSYGLYLNDFFSYTLRSSDTIQIMSIKYEWSNFVSVLWFDNIPNPTFCLKESNVYVLGKVQCQNEEGDKWFGDTFNLKEGESIIKCVWYLENDLKNTFLNLSPILKDLLNLYLTLGNQVLKKEKLKLKPEHNYNIKIIREVMVKYNLTNLVENIQNLSCFETFKKIFLAKINETSYQPTYTNIQNVFKDEPLPLRCNQNVYSLMVMSDVELKDNFYYLMHYILPQNQREIFKTKI